ncbi:PTS sugar transporter subunit IIA [Selenomonas sp. F0473]|uniref:PTS sugar transporter subunit IIA n=1 Tax=Selenomonas sp. F0473 TaxID=999423 RepID=UPI00029E0FC2|nr:PTS sugar transporter subunit IIA [Selenomonas sp. F0473]EKU71918.1 hypothetical protein HMPREF9161_00603 [Selenomonas sp. F0473]
MIEQLFTAQTVAVDVPARDWEEAVRFGGALLAASGAAEERYGEAMVETVKSIGSYIVIAPGLAMPHARPECGAKRLGMAFVRLAHPVPFGNEEYDPVDLLVFLCAPDHNSHISAIAELMELIEDEAFLTRVRAGMSKDEILDDIRKKEFSAS